MRTSILVVLPSIALFVAGCEAEARTPSPPRANLVLREGAATPQELIEQLEEVASTRSIAALVPLVAPDRRVALTFCYGIIVPTGRIARSSVGSGQFADPRKLDEASDAFEVLLRKHGIDSEKLGLVDETVSFMQDPRASVPRLHKTLGRIDHVRFLADAKKFSEERLGMQNEWAIRFPSGFHDLAVQGEKAGVAARSTGTRIDLVKRRGRWFLDYVSLLPGG